MDLRLTPLEPADAFRLRAAEGWLELGDTASANEELDQLSAGVRAHPAVLFMRCLVSLREEKWDRAAELSETLTHLLPEVPEPWVNLAFATRRKTGGSIMEAKKILLKIEPNFPRQYVFPFNLACYCSQLGQFDEAERWLDKAMTIDGKTVRQMALQDDDLKPFLQSTNGTLWKNQHPQS